MPRDLLLELQTRLGYKFHRRERLRQALTHRSWSHEQNHTATNSDNERMEFLGDAVLGLRVSERLLERYPESSEGELSRLRGWIISARNLAASARVLELGEALRLSRAEEGIGGRGKPRLLANALEAVIAAIHQDGGHEAAAEFIDRHILGASLERLSPNQVHEFAYKSALQEWAHAHGRPLPAYRVVAATGPEHTKTFEVEVALPEVFTGSAHGKSKKDAEQAAAKKALEHLGLLP